MSRRARHSRISSRPIKKPENTIPPQGGGGGGKG